MLLINMVAMGMSAFGTTTGDSETEKPDDVDGTTGMTVDEEARGKEERKGDG